MHDKLSQLAVLILQTLAQNISKDYTLEELTNLVFPALPEPGDLVLKLQTQNILQAELLETLIYLDDNLLVYLHPATDQTHITAAGLQAISAC